MYVFMHGLRADRMSTFIDQLCKHPTPLETFFLIPSVILELNCQGMLNSIDIWHKKIYQLECSTGVRWDGQEPQLDNVDLTKLTRDINSATTNLAYFAWSCKTYLSMLDFLDQIARQYREQAVLNGLSDADAAHIESCLLARHDYLRCWLTGMERRVEFLSKRGQAQVQTVRPKSFLSLQQRFYYIIFPLR